MAGDAYFNTSTTNFNKSVVPLVLKELQATLRGGLSFTPKGSVIPAVHVKGTDGTFRAFEYADLPEDTVVALGDSDADPSLQDFEASYIEFSASRKGDGVALTDNVQKLSPHNLLAIASEKVARSIAVHMDGVARAIYAASTPALFGGTGNTDVAGVAAGDKMTALLLKQAVATLRALDVPTLPSGTYALVADPFVLLDLQADDDFVNEMRHADPATFLTGETARYAGASLIDAGSRGLVRAGAGTGSIDIHTPVLIGANSIFAALGDIEVHALTGADKSDRWNRRDSVTWKAFTGGVKNDLQSIERFLTLGVATSL